MGAPPSGPHGSRHRVAALRVSSQTAENQKAVAAAEKNKQNEKTTTARTTNFHRVIFTDRPLHNCTFNNFIVFLRDAATDFHILRFIFIGELIEKFEIIKQMRRLRLLRSRRRKTLEHDRKSCFFPDCR